MTAANLNLKRSEGVKRPQGEWTKLITPIVRKFEVAAAVNGRAVWNAQGSAAMAKLIREMAQKLDAAIASGKH